MEKSESSKSSNENKRDQYDFGGDLNDKSFKLIIGTVGFVLGALVSFVVSSLFGKSEKKEKIESLQMNEVQISSLGSKLTHNLSFRPTLDAQIVHFIPDDYYEFLKNFKITSSTLLQRQIKIGSAASNHPAILFQCSQIESPDPVFILLDFNMDTGYYIRIYFKQEQIHQEYDYISQQTITVKPDLQQFRNILNFIISLSQSNQNYDPQLNNDKVFITKLKQFINIPTDLI